MNAPALSIIVPVYNGEAFLPAALASIAAQGRADAELVIVDDGSTDGTAAAVARLAPAARYFRQDNAGPSAARNTGLAHARAPLVAFLDVDDEWAPGALDRLAAALAARPDAMFVLGRTRFLPRTPGEPVPEPWVSPNLGAALYRREVFARVGTFNVARSLTEDVDWFLRAREAGVVYATIEDVTLHYRRRAGSQSAGRSWADPALKATILASLARRRAAGGGQARELTLLSGSKDDPRAAGTVNRPPDARPAD